MDTNTEKPRPARGAILKTYSLPALARMSERSAAKLGAQPFGASVASFTMENTTFRLARYRAADCTAWDAALATYRAAKAVEEAYDAKHIDPIFGGFPVGPERSAATHSIPRELWDESSRLTDVRCDAEELLIEMPSPDAAAFALKYLIAHGDGRDLNGWDEMLEAEARRFAGELA